MARRRRRSLAEVVADPLRVPCEVRLIRGATRLRRRVVPYPLVHSVPSKRGCLRSNESTVVNGRIQHLDQPDAQPAALVNLGR
jgi:hypothetical protein